MSGIQKYGLKASKKTPTKGSSVSSTKQDEAVKTEEKKEKLVAGKQILIFLIRH